MFFFKPNYNRKTQVKYKRKSNLSIKTQIKSSGMVKDTTNQKKE